MLDQGVTILADRAFTTTDEAALYGVRVLTPAFMNGMAQVIVLMLKHHGCFPELGFMLRG